MSPSADAVKSAVAVRGGKWLNKYYRPPPRGTGELSKLQFKQILRSVAHALASAHRGEALDEAWTRWMEDLVEVAKDELLLGQHPEAACAAAAAWAAARPTPAAARLSWSGWGAAPLDVLGLLANAVLTRGSLEDPSSFALVCQSFCASFRATLDVRRSRLVFADEPLTPEVLDEQERLLRDSIREERAVLAGDAWFSANRLRLQRDAASGTFLPDFVADHYGRPL